MLINVTLILCFLNLKVIDLQKRIQIKAAEGINMDTPDRNPINSMLKSTIDVISPIDNLKIKIFLYISHTPNN